MHAAMTEMLVIVLIIVIFTGVLVTDRMTRAVNFMTSIVTRSNHGASRICRRLESGEDHADKHRYQDRLGHG